MLLRDCFALLLFDVLQLQRRHDKTNPRIPLANFYRVFAFPPSEK
jgi:hypothetical protein